MADRNVVILLHLPIHTTDFLISILDPVKDTTSNQLIKTRQSCNQK